MYTELQYLRNELSERDKILQDIFEKYVYSTWDCITYVRVRLKKIVEREKFFRITAHIIYDYSDSYHDKFGTNEVLTQRLIYKDTMKIF